MPKRLIDGERRTMRIKNDACPVRVDAFRYDSDTPAVILHDPLAEPASDPIFLTDVGARDLVRKIEKALSLLPTSK